ncbi:ECF transporter S component [Polaribacter sp. SA4-12]|uniref:ECF transporter S component n=1 Tax=Polaribacter sp. SA4-12 TaxID=1312072 RepID=UPI000B3C85EF|nr:ECF transporter S component [Polaribacter sp. SA4-12]ARV15530.1 hypothetical protein BTO07_10435 [Polaribacter sp. SA4-12]
MSTNQTNNKEEEVDLGSLFVIIGKGFSKFFNFIGNIFRGIFHGVISILIFLKNNIIKIGIAAILGAILGIFLEVKKTNTFESELLLEPNFKSTRQLYDNINYYNNLVKQKDTAGLVETFKLDKLAAASLKKFVIEPVISGNDIINSYNGFVSSVDTITVNSYTFDKFKSSFTEYDYRFHKVTVTSKQNDVFDKLDDVIISSVVNNKYFNRIKELSNKNLNRTDSLYRKNLIQIDSLRKIYMNVMLEEARKKTAATNIDLGGEKRTTKELELFATSRDINTDLKNIASEKATKYEVINVLSNFQPIGSEVKGVTKNYAFLLTILGAGFMILFLLVRLLNKYLNTYKK